MDPRERLVRNAIFVFALGSGGLAVGYEILWTRHLLNLFGSTTLATAAMLAAFMAGMALGALAIGRLPVTSRRPLALYAGIELALVLYALAFERIAEAVGGILPATLMVGSESVPFILLGRLFGQSAVVLAPTVLMGAALPVLASALQFTGASKHEHVARLYGLNVLGGVLGSVATGFLLLPGLGLALSQAALSTFAICIFIAALSVDRLVRSRVVREEFTVTQASISAQAIPYATIKWALFLSGFAALGYEVVWTRILVLVVGSSTYAFTLMLFAYLLGLALGALWIGRYVGRLRAPLVIFQQLQLGIALAAVGGVAFFSYLPRLALAGIATFGGSMSGTVAVNATIALVLVLAPTFFIGAAFPVGVRLLQRDRIRRGREIGTALACVSGGHVLGVLATALIIVPAAGLRWGIVILAAGNALAAALVWARTSRRTPWEMLTTPVAIAGLVALAWLLPPWNTYLMNSGIYRQAPAYLSLLGSWRGLERAFSQYRTRFYREGREAVVAVFERPTLGGEPHVVLTIDGKVDASTGTDMSTQILSGYIPMLFNSGAENALVIGLASGVTVGALAQHPLKEIDVVEIESAVVEASRAFDSESHAPLDDPRVSVIVEDGRQYLRAVPKRYDVIVSEPSNPWLSSSARLFTKEFFTLVKDRLVPDGVFVQWVPLYGLGEAHFLSLLRTLTETFSASEVFRVADGDLLFVSSTKPLTFSPERIEWIFREETRRADMSRAGIRAAEDLAVLWVADDQGLTSLVQGASVNTDDNGLIEFGSPWYLLRDTSETNLALLRTATTRSRLGAYLTEIWLSRESDLSELATIARRHIDQRNPGLAFAIAKALRQRGHVVEADVIQGDEAFRKGDFESAIRLWAGHKRPDIWAKLATLFVREGRFSEALAYFSRVPASRLTADQRVLYALAHLSLREESEALEILSGVSNGAYSPAVLMAPLLRSRILKRQGRDDAANDARTEFIEAVNRLRRCLEQDGCRTVMDNLQAWLNEFGSRLPVTVRTDAQQIFHVALTRPLAFYYRGVRHLWLGEYAAAAASLRRYLQLLPADDLSSKAYKLIKLVEQSMSQNGSSR